MTGSARVRCICGIGRATPLLGIPDCGIARVRRIRTIGAGSRHYPLFAVTSIRAAGWMRLTPLSGYPSMRLSPLPDHRNSGAGSLGVARNTALRSSEYGMVRAISNHRLSHLRERDGSAYRPERNTHLRERDRWSNSLHPASPILRAPNVRSGIVRLIRTIGLSDPSGPKPSATGWFGLARSIPSPIFGSGMERSTPRPQVWYSGATPQNRHRDVLLKKKFEKEKLSLITRRNK